MKKYIYIIALVVISCVSNTNQQNKEAVTTPVVNTDPQIQTPITEHEEVKRNILYKIKDPYSHEIDGYLYAYEDSIKIFSEPSDSSEILGHLNCGERIKIFFNNARYIDKYGYMAVNHDNDTGWIFHIYSKVSTKNMMDTVKNIIIRHYYGTCLCSSQISCYNKSIITNKLTLDTIAKWGETNIESTFQVNDSLLVINPPGKLIFYDLDNDSILLKTDGNTALVSNLFDCLYFFNDTDTLRLKSYNLKNNSISTLYTEIMDSTMCCYSNEYYLECPQIELETLSDIEYLYFKIFRNKPMHLSNYEYEPDVFRVKIDHTGKLYYRKK